MTAPTDTMLGRLTLGRYRIIKPLARGGMGVVYLGRTEGAAGFSRPVIVKRILPDLTNDPNMAKMFVREARILSLLHHPGIVSVVDFGQEDDAYVMVLEYVHGYDLGRWHKYLLLAQHGMPPEYACHVVTRVLEAAHHAHTMERDGKRLNIVHRDISPGNILIDLEGQVKLVDFGVARMEHESSEYRTQEGIFKGKLSYAAPELLQGQEASAQSDLYSCAVVLYQLLTGQHPFRGKSMPDTVAKVLNYDPGPPSAVARGVDSDIDGVLAKALAKTRKDRYPTALAFADALRSVRKRSEEAIYQEMLRALQRDFNSDMPDLMGLTSLTVRDAAWREAQDAPLEERVPLDSTRPKAGSSSSPPAGEARPLSQPALTKVEIPLSKVRDRSRLGVLVIVAAISGAAAVAGGVTWLLQPKPPGAPRYLVVEQGNPSPESPSASVAAAGAPVATETAVTGVAGSNALPPAGEDKPTRTTPAAGTVSAVAGKPDPAALTRRFMTQEPRIRQCFTQHASNISGKPQMSIGFRVDTRGNVESAALSPATLSSTPLGQCILGAARQANFGPQNQSFNFTIPITASKG